MDTAGGPLFGVCYAGLSPESAFAETFLRAAPVRVVSQTEVGLRRIAEIETLAPVTVAEIHGPGLAQAGVTGTVTASPFYADSQALCASLWSSTTADAIEYRCRHDNGEIAYAIFDRAQAHLRVLRDEPLQQDWQRLARWAQRYGFGLI